MKDSAGFVEKMKQWQDRMSNKFRDTWEGWRGKNSDTSIGAASVDLREQKDSYTVRLNLPERDLGKVDIKLEGNALHLAAPAEKKAGRYEQTITLASVAPDAKLVIDPRQMDNLIVVTVQKSQQLDAGRPSLTLPDPSLAPLRDWARDIFTSMDKMRRAWITSSTSPFRLSGQIMRASLTGRASAPPWMCRKKTINTSFAPTWMPRSPARCNASW